MDRAGEKLRRARERLKLTYRDVVEASREMAQRRGNDEFQISLSRLADIENTHLVPTVFRLYTLCAVYRLDFHEVMRWYGVPVDLLASEALAIGLEETHTLDIEPHGFVAIPQSEKEFDLTKTTFLSPLIRQWGKLPLSLMNGAGKHHRYGLVGLDDWSMFPVLRPGSLVLIDERRRRIARGGWANEFERPIYFLEHREGFVCGWCVLEGGRLVLQPHPASEKQPAVFRHPDEIEVVGQVTGVAMLLEGRKRRPSRETPVAVSSTNGKAVAK